MKEIRTGVVTVPLPVEKAMRYFTPEGEREWVPGWDPEYGDDEPSEDPGTFFKTTFGGVETFWIITELEVPTGRAAYARFTPGRHAGIVRVRCEMVSTSVTDVHVTYDITLLPDSDAAHLSQYTESGFENMMREWNQTLVDRILGQGAGRGH